MRLETWEAQRVHELPEVALVASVDGVRATAMASHVVSVQLYSRRAAGLVDLPVYGSTALPDPPAGCIQQGRALREGARVVRLLCTWILW